MGDAPERAKSGLCAASEAIRTIPRYRSNNFISSPLTFVFSLIKKTKIAIEKIVKSGALIVVKILGNPLNGIIAIGINVINTHKSRLI